MQSKSLFTLDRLRSTYERLSRQTSARMELVRLQLAESDGGAEGAGSELIAADQPALRQELDSLKAQQEAYNTQMQALFGVFERYYPMLQQRRGR